MVIREEPTEDLSLPDAIRKLRQEAGITQAQLAMAIDVAPTSIYRYEAGTSTPDLETIKQLAKFSSEQSIQWAQAYFGGVLLRGLDISKIANWGDPYEGPTDASLSLKVEGRALTPREQLMVIAFVLLMRNNTNEMTENIIRVLIDPWMSKARAEFDRLQQSIGSRTDDAAAK